MSFKKDIENYKTLVDTKELYYKTIPSGFWNEFGQFIHKCIDEDNYQDIISGISQESLINYNSYMGDSDSFAYDLKRKVNNDSFYMLFDCLGVLAINTTNGQNAVNEFLERHNIGYRCSCESPFNSLYWYTIDENEIIDKINNISQEVIPYSKQAFQEFERIKKTLEDVENNERACKDAVRSAVNAFESLIKNIAGNENEIKKAIDKLISQNKWKKEILNYGKTLWHAIHELYPDLRHGSIDTSKMDIDEAKYWVEKIINYSRYLISKVN